MNANNDIVIDTYSGNGQIVSTIKITEDSVKKMVQNTDSYHHHVAVPEVSRILEDLSEAAEAYAEAGDGDYPQEMQALLESNPPYLKEGYCNQVVNPHFRIHCKLKSEGYEFLAESTWPQYESYSIRTGGVFDIVDVALSEVQP